MRRAGKKVAWALVLVLAGLGIAGGAGVLWLRASLPRSGEVARLDGVSAPVEILRDGHGVPHIFAQSTEDALFAVGYVHAQDRLWQMEGMRRLGAGRLAEAVGAPALKSDRFMRTLGLYRRAEEQYVYLAEDVRRALDAYAAGVNAWLLTHRGTLPPEFVLLGIEPEPWRPADSLVWIKIMALRLATNHRKEILRARLAEVLAPGQVDDLWPPYPATDPATIGDPAKALGGAGVGDILDQQPAWQRWPRTASNAWVVAGSLTVTGKPLLANDPHLGFSAPILWYLLRIEAPGFNVSGASSPGFPFPVLGHNHRIAWGMTSTGSDIEDVFVEIVDPENPERYLAPDGPAHFEVRVETIKVDGADDVELIVRETRHGPVIADLLEPAAGFPAPTTDDSGADADARKAAGGRVLALAATYLQDRDRSPEAALRVLTAGNWRQFVDALENFHAPQLNFVYADVDGDIGFVAPGRVPVRRSGRGAVPSPGWNGRFDWTGFVPFDALPQVHNPPSGRLINANNRIGPSDYPWYLGDSWDDGYRARRIADMLSEGDPKSPDSMGAMQMDSVSPMARHLLPKMLGQLPDRERFRGVARMLQEWSGEMSRDRPEPLIFVAWLRAFNRAVYADELGELWPEYWDHRPRFIASVLGEKSGWCDDIGTPAREDCAARLETALDDALGELSSGFGDNARDWRWGDVHRARFAHPLFTHVPVLNAIADLEIETDGGFYTVNRGANFLWDPIQPYAHVHGAGFRAVYDLSNLRESRFVIATGQSGNPLSEHYRDMLRLWADGGWIRLGQTREDLERRATSRLVLKP